MHAMAIASSLIGATQRRSRSDAEAMDLLYRGPAHNLKDVARVVAMIGGIALYAGLLGVVGRHVEASRPTEAAILSSQYYTPLWYEPAWLTPSATAPSCSPV